MAAGQQAGAEAGVAPADVSELLALRTVSGGITRVWGGSHGSRVLRGGRGCCEWLLRWLRVVGGLGARNQGFPKEPLVWGRARDSLQGRLRVGVRARCPWLGVWLWAQGSGCGYVA